MFARHRRYRTTSSHRQIFQDVYLRSSDFILPVIVTETPNTEDGLLPFIHRLTPQEVVHKAHQALSLGVTCMALFPHIPDHEKETSLKKSFDPNGLIPRTLSLLKKECPKMLLMADIALDPFNPTGHDGWVNQSGQVDNDKTLRLLCEQALTYAHAGADIIAPSDMMDGRIGAIRKALEQRGLIDTLILSYSTKFASSLYEPFRASVGSKKALGSADKLSYQMDPASTFQFSLEASADIQQGADMLLVKPGLHYLDVIAQLSQSYNIPIWSYHVSGECALIYFAAQNKIASFEKLLYEALIAQKRAGAHKIITYYALEAAQLSLSHSISQ